ncbi:hypothetical protein MKW94_008793 [Papaver nudicaule]|uniref:Beta-glucosidase n=1 Tax=Papaver nudicaule TaxID=74823 RepID=A0AA41S782_PAPNU|nr:hypothetical protein [Papaver nudicaule]
MSNFRYAKTFVFGDYPESMKRNVGSRFPSFTPYEAKLVKGSRDFFGVNHYASTHIKDYPESPLIQHETYFLIWLSSYKEEKHQLSKF